jgi:putative N-acetyltransferase (TIGR04045 family)
MTDVDPFPFSSDPRALLELPTRVNAAPALECRPVDGLAELATHFVLRRLVFVDEQGLFADDRDDHDDDPATVHVLGFVDGVPAGTVRLYPIEGALWKGDRLAVRPDARRAGLGAPLVRYAVSTAQSLAGQQMNANVQMENVSFFRRLGWTTVGGPALYVGRLHQAMTIVLA